MTDHRASRLLTKMEIPLLLAVPAVMTAALLVGIEQAALAMLVVVALVLALFFAGYETSRPGLRQIMPTLVLAALAAAGSAVAQALGGWDVALKVLICFMALDYVTGWLVAAVWHKSAKSKTGALDSKASYKGLVKKGVMLALVWMAALLDQATHSDFVRDAVCLFFIANEGLSVLENTAVMGVPYPAFVKNMLDALHQTGDQGKGTEART